MQTALISLELERSVPELDRSSSMELDITFSLPKLIAKHAPRTKVN